MERKYIDYFSSLIKKKVIPVGPLVQHPISKYQRLEAIEWLAKKNHSSTLFVSFGSEFPVGDETKVEEALPEGFLDRVRDRGMIINGWAPQAKILTHSSLGGFVSQSEWNSVMEIIEFGVPIIAIPMHCDQQPLNARLVVDIGLGMEVRRDYCEKLHGEEVAKVIKDVILDNKGEDMRRKARELRENIRLKGEEEINVAVGEISQLCHKSKAQ
ncbi:unnamed protein product [Ilex paraguariensis]|uniref:Uncharacterized protein n=1 Tax=Ilex paraguariensis TaxID=185542 RepID=A0ABC8QQJ1_9AQUA